jgi:hypothetical protein
MDAAATMATMATPSAVRWLYSNASRSLACILVCSDETGQPFERDKLVSLVLFFICLRLCMALRRGSPHVVGVNRSIHSFLKRSASSASDDDEMVAAVGVYRSYRKYRYDRSHFFKSSDGTANRPAADRVDSSTSHYHYYLDGGGEPHSPTDNDTDYGTAERATIPIHRPLRHRPSRRLDHWIGLGRSNIYFIDAALSLLPPLPVFR